MELRHLRYFVAVAEEGSVLNAAQGRLNTSQPSLSRQIRDLEAEVGVKLLERQARGVVLTAAGSVFLDHVRLALLQVDAATEAARRAAQPNRATLSIGFMVAAISLTIGIAFGLIAGYYPGLIDDGVNALTCIGYTDSTGHSVSNRQLGKLRAQSVCGLLRKLGVKAQMKIVSAGEARPRASNATEQGRALNRRVELDLDYR